MERFEGWCWAVLHEENKVSRNTAFKLIMPTLYYVIMFWEKVLLQLI